MLSHEILTARPYAFLDDEELQNRRTNAVVLRRGLAVDLASIGALDPAAIEQVHAEITPEPVTADDLHDLLGSLVVCRPRDDWRPLWAELVERGRAWEPTRPDGRTGDRGDVLWCTTELADDAARALQGDESAIASMLRGHLETAGISTVERLAAATTLPATRVEAGLAVLQQEGFALQGSYTPDAGQTEWVARRLLARMHSYSRRTRRGGVDPVTTQDFMRFLLRWQHVAPGTQLVGEAGLATVIEQLQGFEAAAVAWEPEVLRRRMRAYDPSWLDLLCFDGQVGWLRLVPPVRAADAPVGSPSKATPIALVFRDDLGWLLRSARDGTEVVEPAVGATAEVLEVLRARGASFAAQLAAATRRLPDDVERALWDGVARGLIMCDGFSVIRARVNRNPNGHGRGRNGDPMRLSRLRRGSRAAAGAAGRWAAVPALGAGDDDAAPAGGDGADLDGQPDAPVDREDLAEAVAEQLLNRWGVVFRDLALSDSLRFPWRDIQRALRRLEDRGLVRGGRFVTGFAGEQFALPAAVEQLNETRKLPRDGTRVVVNAVDPLNLVGVIVPGATVPGIRTREVVYLDGVPAGERDGVGRGIGPTADRRGG